VSRTWLATFRTEIYRRVGDEYVTIHDGAYRPNLRTTDGGDWQSALLGGPSESSAQLTGTATATGATSLTNSGATFPTSGGYGNTASSPLAGKIVVALVSGGAYGVILSNTSTALTIDRWNNPASPGGAAASTPSATCNYAIFTAAFPSWWMALSTDATSPSASDHTLASELTTNGLGRALGGWTHTNGTTSATLNNLFTSTGGSNTINKEAIFNAQNGGIMTFESAEPSPPPLISGDTLSQSVQVSM